MRHLRLLGLCILACSIVGVGNALAAGSAGFRVETPEAAPQGKGSAFVGEANTPGAVYYNPAGINQIQNVQVSVGGAVIVPRGSYKGASGKTDMKKDVFLIPHVYGVVPINQKLALGFGSSSYWGLGTDWGEDTFSRYLGTKNEITNMDTMLVASYRVTDNWSVALSADNDNTEASQNKKLIQDGIAAHDGNLQLKGKDNAWGYRIATMVKINDQHQVGLMYRSAIHHNYIGKVYLDNLGTTPIAAFGGFSYQDVFGGTSYETRATQKLTLPQSVIMGYSFKLNNKWRFNFDLEWMNWSQVKQAIVNFPDAAAGPASVLNQGGTTSYRWHSVFSEAIGAEYSATDQLRLRFGYYHHAQTVPGATFQPPIPDSNAHGMTLGFGYDFNQHLTIDMAYSAIIYEARKIANGLSAAAAPGSDADGKYKQFTNFGIFTLTYKY